MKRLVIAIMAAISVLLVSGEDSSIVSTVAKGMGTTPQEALENSFRDAVERTVGVFVDAEQQVENADIIQDQVLTQSNAYIKEYRKTSERIRPGGIYEVSIIAKVKKVEIQRKLKDSMPDKRFSLGDALKRRYEERKRMSQEREERRRVAEDNETARRITIRKRDDGAIALLKNVLKNINPSASMVDISAARGRPNVLDKNGSPSVVFGLRISVAQERYFKVFMPKLKQVLEQIATEPPKIKSVIMSRAGRSEGDRETRKMPGALVDGGDMLPFDASALWDPCFSEGEGELPYLSLNFHGDYDGMFWIVESVKQGNGRARVVLSGYRLPKECIKALAGIAAEWTSLGDVKFLAELRDDSGKMVAKKTLTVGQDMGWMGWGRNISAAAADKNLSFYVLPWFVMEVGNKLKFYNGGYYDQNGNYYGKNAPTGTGQQKIVADEVRFNCMFEVLEDELKDISSIHIGVLGASSSGRLK